MCAAVRYRLIFILLLSTLVPAINTASAGPPSANADWAGARAELWLAVSSWPGLGDLQPAAGGAFDTTGYGLGAAVHWPVAAFEHSTLLFGVEGAIMATESDVPVYLDDLLARDAYYTDDPQALLDPAAQAGGRDV